MFRKGIRNIEEEGARTECDKWTCTLGKEEQVILFLVLRSLNSSRYLGIIYLFVHFFHSFICYCLWSNLVSRISQDLLFF